MYDYRGIRSECTYFIKNIEKVVSHAVIEIGKDPKSVGF